MEFRSKVALQAVAERERHEAETRQRLSLMHGLDEAARKRMAGDGEFAGFLPSFSVRLTINTTALTDSLRKASMSMAELAAALAAIAPAAAGTYRRPEPDGPSPPTERQVGFPPNARARSPPLNASLSR
jgi:hypothetical protein